MEKDHEIKQAALDYIEGWYQADAARMARALHPVLAKRRIATEGEIWEVSKDWMVEATGNGRGRIEDPENGKKEVTILDSTEAMSCVKIVSEKFIDYLHLAKDNGKWQIVNVLWDFVS